MPEKKRFLKSVKREGQAIFWQYIFGSVKKQFKIAALTSINQFFEFLPLSLFICYIFLFHTFMKPLLDSIFLKLLIDIIHALIFLEIIAKRLIDIKKHLMKGKRTERVAKSRKVKSDSS